MVLSTAVAGMLAAVLWGASPVVSKRGFSYGGNPRQVTLIVISSGLLVLWAVLIVQHGFSRVTPDISAFGYAVFLGGGVIGTALGRIGNYTGIDRLGASVNSAVVATNPLFATTLAFVFLGEAITGVQAIGIVLVVLGLVVLTLAKGGDLGGWKRAELVFPLLAAMAFGTGGVIRRFGLTTTGASPIEGAVLNEIAAFGAIAGYLVAREGPTFEPIPRRATAYFVATGILSGLGLLMLFTGLQFGRVAIVSTLVATSTLFATVFSYFFLRDLERVTRGIVAGATLVVIGVGLITLS